MGGNYLAELEDSGGDGLLREALRGIEEKLGKGFHREGGRKGEKYYWNNEEGINKGLGKGQHGRKGEEMQIEDLWGHHHEVARLGLLGFSKESIAQELGLSAVTVQKISRLPAVREKMLNLTQERDAEIVPIVERIRKLAIKAVDRMDHILHIEPEDEDPRLLALQLATAKDVLDRAGHAAVKKTVSINTHEIEVGKRASILQGIRERAFSKGVVNVCAEDDNETDSIIDITFEEEGE